MRIRQMAIFLTASVLPFAVHGQENLRCPSQAGPARIGSGRMAFAAAVGIQTALRSDAPPPPGMKKPVVGALLSGLIPGSGQVYAGSWLKAAGFLSAEVALWVGYAQYSKKGREWDDVFHVYADAHWSEPEYWVFIAGPGLANIADVNEGTYTQYLDALREYERAHFSHGLHVEKDQQYYEMIGKYDQFRAGWDDYTEGQPALTPNRDHYENLRHKSNVQFKRASACAMIAIANHALSAFDAGLTIRNKNRRYHATVRTEPRFVCGDVVPLAVFRLEWGGSIDR